MWLEITCLIELGWHELLSCLEWNSLPLIEWVLDEDVLSHVLVVVVRDIIILVKVVICRVDVVSYWANIIIRGFIKSIYWRVDFILLCFRYRHTV